MAIMEESKESTPDVVYKWVTRSIYTAAIGLNLWYLLEQYRDSPEASRIMVNLNKARTKLVKPWHDRKHFRRQATAVQLEAWNIVDEARSE